MKSFKLVYGYPKTVTINGKSKKIFHVLETLVNQGNAQLCSYIKDLKKKSGCYNTHKLKTVSINGLKYNDKFKY